MEQYYQGKNGQTCISNLWQRVNLSKIARIFRPSSDNSPNATNKHEDPGYQRPITSFKSMAWSLKKLAKYLRKLFRQRSTEQHLTPAKEGGFAVPLDVLPHPEQTEPGKWKQHLTTAFQPPAQAVGGYTPVFQQHRGSLSQPPAPPSSPRPKYLPAQRFDQYSQDAQLRGTNTAMSPLQQTSRKPQYGARLKAFLRRFRREKGKDSDDLILRSFHTGY